MADPTIWRPEPPDWHPGADHACPLACLGVWREVSGHGTKERGWRWQCDHLRCPIVAKRAANG